MMLGAMSPARSLLRTRVRLLILALGATIAAACGGSSSSPTGPTTPGDSQPIAYSAIGASDAVGIGGSVPCATLAPCPNGTGYVPVLARRLGEGGRQVTLTNLGIPAAVLSPEMQTLAAAAGSTTFTNMIQHELPLLPAGSTLVTVFAGGNDTNAIAAAVERGFGGSDPAGYVDEQVRVFGSGYDTLIRGIRDRASGARIIVMNLPNLAGLPYASGYSLLRQRSMQRASVGITTQVVNRLSSQNVLVIDLMCDARVYDPGNLASDGFHPNDAGYALLADMLYRAYTSGSSPPAASCPQMNVVPPL